MVEFPSLKGFDLAADPQSASISLTTRSCFHPSKGSTSQLTRLLSQKWNSRKRFPSLKGFDLAADLLISFLPTVTY